jgi:phosphoribosylformimino-5-aminoimidazole carboxamide ribotide isomerase
MIKAWSCHRKADKRLDSGDRNPVDTVYRRDEFGAAAIPFDYLHFLQRIFTISLAPRSIPPRSGLANVDLSGDRLARRLLCASQAGRLRAGDQIRRITAAVSIPCQVGGGLRDDSHVLEALRWGVRRFVLGTRALKDPAWLRTVCERHGGRVVLGLDARDGRIATHGWLETSEQAAIEVAQRVSAWPLAAIVYTDIRRDGMLEGPNFEALAEMRAAVAVPVFASGGVTTVEDVQRLAALKLDGCIIGRALYEGRIDLAAAVKNAGVKPGPN